MFFLAATLVGWIGGDFVYASEVTTLWRYTNLFIIIILRPGLQQDLQSRAMLLI